MKYAELINHCIEIRRTWDPVIQSLDAHADEYLKKFTDDNEKVFIKQVFFGTYRYEEFIKAFNSALFKKCPAETNRNDASLNGIFIYLVCFRFNELPYEEFKKIVLSQNPVKINVLFQLLFNIELLRQYVRDEWCKLYDADYIDDVIIAGIEKNLPKAADLLANVSLKATGKVSDFVSTLGTKLGDKDAFKKVRKPTTAQPFHLTQPKVKALPEPIVIPKIVKANPVPNTTYKTPLRDVQSQKERRREDIREETKKKFEEGKAQRFSLKTEQRPTNIEKLKEEAEEKARKQNEKKGYYKPVPMYDHSQFDIKMNAATILKEEAIIKRSKQEEEEYVRQIEMNQRDSSEYDQWKKEQDDKDALAKLELQERRRVEMQLAREAAMKAVEDKGAQNKENVQKMKEMSKEHKKEIENKIVQEYEHKKQLKDGIVEARDNLEIEKQKVVQEKKKMHDELKKEKKERWFMKVEEDEIEKKKRDELIRRIRELERRPRDKVKNYDATETMGFGLLEEMSIVQLRERLEQIKVEKKEEEEKKRIENLKKKEEKESELKVKLAEIQMLRQEKAKEQVDKRQQKIQQEEDEKRRKEAVREKSLLEVHGKITQKKEDKKVELERIAKELREIKLKRQYLNADKAVLEAQAWKSLEDGAEREIRARQNQKLMEQEGVESIKLKERKILAQRATEDIETRLDHLRDYDERLEEAKQHNEVLFREERDAKKKNHEEIRKFEQAHLDNMVTRDPFKSKISAMSLSNARSTLNNTKNTVVTREEIVLPPSKYTDMKDNGMVITEKPERLES